MLYFMVARHAQAEHNLERDIITGRAPDAKLTQQGISQATRLGEYLARNQARFDHVYSSTSPRALHTARLVCDRLRIPLESIVTSDALLENDQGAWTGKVRSETYTPEVKLAMDAGKGDFCPPEGESLNMVEARMLAEMDMLATNGLAGKKHGSVLVVSHGLAIRCLYRGITDSPKRGESWKLKFYHTAFATFSYDGEWHCLAWNKTPHLAREHVTN